MFRRHSVSVIDRRASRPIDVFHSPHALSRNIAKSVHRTTPIQPLYRDLPLRLLLTNAAVTWFCRVYTRMVVIVDAAGIMSHHAPHRSLTALSSRLLTNRVKAPSYRASSLPSSRSTCYPSSTTARPLPPPRRRSARESWPRGRRGTPCPTWASAPRRTRC